MAVYKELWAPFYLSSPMEPYSSFLLCLTLFKKCGIFYTTLSKMSHCSLSKSKWKFPCNQLPIWNSYGSEADNRRRQCVFYCDCLSNSSSFLKFALRTNGGRVLPAVSQFVEGCCRQSTYRSMWRPRCDCCSSCFLFGCFCQGMPMF